MRAWFLLGLLGVLLASTDARADCGIPQWIGTADGTAVPFAGSLYIYDESLAWADQPTAQPMADVSWEGKAGSVEFKRVGNTVTRLDYVGFAGTTLKVHLRQWDETLSYRLVEHWRPSTRAPRVLRYWHHASSWTCSHADSLMVQIDQRAAAVRARWTSEGKTAEWILPARTERSKVVVELGKINCGTTTLAPEQLLAGGTLQLAAIRFDGSEVPITGLPNFISSAELASDDRGLDGALTLVSLDQPKPAAQPPRKPSTWIAIAAIALLSAGLLIGLRLAGRSTNGCSPALR